MMDLERLQDILDGERPDGKELGAMLSEYPYWITPALISLKEGIPAEGFEKSALRMKVAASVGDPSALDMLADEDGDIFEDFYPDMQKREVTTDDAIDRFIDTFSGGNLPKETPEEIPLAAPAVDYATMLEAGMYDDEPEDEPESVEEEPAQIAVKTDGQPALTESLALVMIKNHNYEKALEIISALNLNNPQKSAYFADQMRFLRKLIINEQKS